MSWGLALVLHVGLEHLHLECQLVHFVLISDPLRSLHQDLLGECTVVVLGPVMLDHEVGGQGGLVRGQAPGPEVVKLYDPVHGEEGLLHHVVLQPAGGCLHQDFCCVFDDFDCGDDDDEAEDKCADGVNDGVLRLEVDYQRSYEHT